MRPGNEFVEQSRRLESAYLDSDDPIARSGFSGGRVRWVVERSPLVDAIDRNGDFLDVGCANGLLAEDVVTWAQDGGFILTPHGVDRGTGLVDLARARLPGFADNFLCTDAWSWEPERRWTYVYSLLDLAPQELWCEWLNRLLGWVAPGGRLIIGSYGSRSRDIVPVDVSAVMESCGLPVEGMSSGGDPIITQFAWTALSDSRDR